MKNHHNDPQLQKRLRALLLLLCGACVVLGVVYMKKSSSEEKSFHSGSVLDTANRQVAVPDTSIDPSVLPAAPDTFERSVLPDTLLGRDKRSPYEAGYEDGYAAGCDDGAAGQEKATYDEGSNFASSKDREVYAEGYREGYAKGFEDGKAGKQFNI